ncbi:Glycerophosphoryl diester phosphodiesterase [Planctomycetes bacterium Poly30]|uniref:Glycerophosphoryl diester phosphodiesterase n=1 Tax=Saltatorellus ferox TaxID=2528018 RepID=A0A518ELZ4_9BACT|nr:Glycerophosphoryl diester phosphodiesterase [Planctomycetes bacterium Poly30]
MRKRTWMMALGPMAACSGLVLACSGLVLACSGLVLACGRVADPGPGTDSGSGVDPSISAARTIPPLPGVMDRIREAGGVLIAAHRGGPLPGYPENALETLEYGLEQGIRVFEIDVAESQDGELYLMHDRSLRRTGGYDGGVADTDWAVVRELDLRDEEGEPTGFHAPRLADVLAWAKRSGALLELDRKETTSFRRILSAVRAAGAENHVLMITYNDQEAIEVARLAPDLMMTAGVKSAEHQAMLAAEGVDFTHVVAWLGTRDPDPSVYAELGARGIESGFGTLGRPGKRLDDVYAADGDASEYQALVDAGLTLLATDMPYFVARELESDDIAVKLLEAKR